ncbi:MAG: hypothetical protein K6A76_03430 [Oribacterium sp.]|nr:hypothetical protein [Oribacterium sp.]
MNNWKKNTALFLTSQAILLFGSVYSLALPLGMIVFGPLADVISLKALMLVSGIVLVMLGFYTFRKKIRNLLYCGSGRKPD